MVANVLIAFGGPGAEIWLYVVFNPSVKVLSQGKVAGQCVDTLVQAG